MPNSISTDALLGAWLPDLLAKALGLSSYQALAKLIYPSPRYETFEIKKRGGGKRTISSPSPRTKEVQRRLLAVLNELDKSRPCAHGFLRGRSVATNARTHALSKIRKTFVFNVDLKDFFSSITFKRVRGIFRAEPFNFSFDTATILAQLCCNAGCLPQGAPTSPALSNYASRSMDGALQELARNHRATYTRYADDLTFSFSCKAEKYLPSEIVSFVGGKAVPGDALKGIIDANGFAVNDAKVYLRSRNQRMEVTGLAVNDVPNVKRRYVDEIRGAMRAWATHGLASAQAAFEGRPYARSTRTGKHPNLAKHLRGKLLYLRMAKGGEDRVYVRLARRFNDLIAASPVAGVSQLTVTPTVIDQSELPKAVFVLSARSAQDEVKSTAFFLSGVGVVTCDHCLRKDADPAGPYMPELYLQDTVETDLVKLTPSWCDEYSDTAVLVPVAGQLLPDHLLLPASDAPTAIGDRVQVVGYPAHSPGKGITCANADLLQKFPKWGFQHYDVSTLIRKGNSGGPVIDLDLRVVGIAKEGAKQEGGNNAVVAIGELLKLHKAKTGP